MVSKRSTSYANFFYEELIDGANSSWSGCSLPSGVSVTTFRVNSWVRPLRPEPKPLNLDEVLLGVGPHGMVWAVHFGPSPPCGPNHPKWAGPFRPAHGFRPKLPPHELRAYPTCQAHSATLDGYSAQSLVGFGPLHRWCKFFVVRV